MSTHASPPSSSVSLFDRICVVTTDDAAVDSAAETAVSLAAGSSADVHALYVVDTAEHWDMVVERREQAGEAAVESVESIGDDRGIDVIKHFRYGTPHAEAITYVEDHDIDLVVVASPKHTGLERVVKPTPVADRLTSSLDVPVLVVGPE